MTVQIYTLPMTKQNWASLTAGNRENRQTHWDSEFAGPNLQYRSQGTVMLLSFLSNTCSLTDTSLVCIDVCAPRTHRFALLKTQV